LHSDGLDLSDLQFSFDPENNQGISISMGNGAGKSGSLFFFSSDNRFLIKTINKDEKNELLGSLNDYLAHYEKSKNKSLLARIYGVFCLRIPNAPEMEFMIL